MKALVIDDEAAMRALIATILRGAGHEVIEAADGRIGMELFERHQPELVITDIVMPNQEGIETIRTLHRLRPDVRIIAISGGGHGQFDFLGMAREFGALATLAKPFRKQELLDVVARVAH